MLVSDLLHSCANDRVAEAAVRSIGGNFAGRIQLEADDRGLMVGAHVSRLIRDFVLRASERDWRDLASALRNHDHPVLAGLQFVVERRFRSVARDECLPGFHHARAVPLDAVAA